MGSNRRHLSLVYVAFIFNSICLSTLFNLQQCLGVGYPLPSICAKQECAPYQVIHSESEFEIRTYTEASWIASPIIDSKTYKNAVRQGFSTLFNYIRGNNTKHVEWNMTAPVLVEIMLYPSYLIFFYVPQKYQNKVPPPYESQHITPVGLPMLKYAAVRRCSGYLDDATIAEEFAALRKSLQASADWKVDDNSTLDHVADFNPPWKVKDRVNEIIMFFDKKN